VICSPLPPDATATREPVALFEVLSEATATIDFGIKNEEYAATPSIKRYVILRQDKAAGIMFERIGDDWVGHLLTAASVLNMPEIDIEVPLAAFYEDVDFPLPEA
jgi:hypothetical protein